MSRPASASLQKPRRKAAAASKLTVREAVALALRCNPQIKIAALKQRAAKLRVKAARWALFPKVKIESSVFVWDRALKLEMPAISVPTPPADCPVSCTSFIGQMFGAMDLGSIRDQFTYQLTVTVAQPVTALFAQLKQLRGKQIGVTVARLERQQKALEIRYAVRKTYLQILQAERYMRIAHDAVKLRKAHLSQAETLQKAQLAARTVVLRIKVALASSRQLLVKSRADVSLARATLRMLIGASPNKRFRLTERYADPPPRYSKSLRDCQTKALLRRPELKILGKRRQILRKSHQAARIMLLPQTTVVAAYQHNEGLGAFQPKNAFFAGIQLSWTFEWGSKYRETQVLSTKALILAHTIKRLRRAIRLEVRKYYLEARTAYQNLQVARAAVRVAAESLRLERLRFGQGSKTATDLLDAQTSYDRARARYTATLFAYYIGLAGLERAKG